MGFHVYKVPIVDDKEYKKYVDEFGNLIKEHPGKKKEKRDVVEDIWDTWCNVTQRPDDAGELDDATYDDIYRAVKLGRLERSHRGLVLAIARTAAFLYPVDPVEHFEGDEEKEEQRRQEYEEQGLSYREKVTSEKKDIIRLIDVLANPSIRQAAEDASNRLDSSIVTYNYSRDMVEKHFAVIEKLFGMTFEDASEPDQSAMQTIALYGQKDFNRMLQRIDDMAKKTGDKDKFFSQVSPRDVLDDMFGASRRNSLRHTRRKRARYIGRREIVMNKEHGKGRYQQGRSEQDVLDETMEVDIQASGMVDEGYAIEDVLEFHRNVPRGYWNKVLEIVNSPDSTGNPEDAYDQLEEEFDFHPYDRKAIEDK